MKIYVKELDDIDETDLWFQIKFRKKSEVVYLNIPRPKGIEVPQGYRGMQTGAIVVYQWECVGENADGIVLPDGFFCKSVIFYVTDLQKKEAVLLDLYQRSQEMGSFPVTEQVAFLISRYPDLSDKIRIAGRDDIIIRNPSGRWLVQLFYREAIETLLHYWPDILL